MTIKTTKNQKCAHGQRRDQDCSLCEDELVKRGLVNDDGSFPAEYER